MTPPDFTKFRAEFNAECEALLLTKGKDYTDGTDQLSSFNDIAEELGIDPMQVWAVYAMKHVKAIMSFARNGKVESEPIRSRFIDASNYFALGAALAEEKAKGENS